MAVARKMVRLLSGADPHKAACAMAAIMRMKKLGLDELRRVAA